jgi:exosortase/archaeosortase family protein
MGLILPLPRGTWNRKIIAVIVVTVILFIANVLRVVFEIWLVYMGILPWELAHYPMSFVLGVVGVFVLCIVAIVLVPGFIETFEDMIFYLFPPKPKEVKGKNKAGEQVSLDDRTFLVSAKEVKQSVRYHS